MLMVTSEIRPSFGLHLRHALLRYGAFICGIGIVLPLLEVLPVFGLFPSPSVIPYLPMIVLGLPYWIVSGRYRRSISIWLILGILTVGFLWTHSPASGVITLAIVLSMIAISALVTVEEDWLIASRWFLVGMILGSSILFYILHFSSPFVTQIGNRLGWISDSQGFVISDPNIVGFHAGFGVLVALSVLTGNQVGNARTFDRRLALFAGVLAFLAVVSTLSLGAVASILGALLAVLLFGSFFRRWQAWVAMVVAGAVALASVALVAPGLFDRISVERLGSASGRVPIWTGALELVTRDVPTLLFGFGTGGGASALGRYDPGLLGHLSGGAPPQVASAGASIPVGVHSTYVSWALAYGLVGLAIAAIALMLVIMRARALDDRKPLAVAMGMVAFFLLISVTQTAFAMAVSISVGCGGMSLGYLFYTRCNEVRRE